jgi:hypothetical protein
MLVDFPKVPAWERGVLEVRQTSSGDPGVGTTLVARRVYAGHEMLVDCRIVDWQDNRSVTMEIVGGPTQVEPNGDHACEVTYAVDGELRPLLRWMTPFLPAAGGRLVRANLASLKRVVEGRRRPGHRGRDLGDRDGS